MSARIRALIRQQPFAVLCTQGGGQPYGSVIAFAASADLASVAFVTSVATRKYRLLCECDQVALVIDSRSAYPRDAIKVEAITATGRATELGPGEETERWAHLLVARHPQIEPRLTSPSSALFRVDIARCLYVTRLQETHHWVPR